MADQSSQSQYAAAARIPLIKSPAVRVPPPVELPPDIHPLPDSVTPYFVYPFTLEPHIVTLESSRRNALATYAARREALFRSREDEKERRRLEALHRVAPGFTGTATPLQPVRSTNTGSTDMHLGEDAGRGGDDVMHNLVEELERMTTTRS